ncbi:hypothetical protein [Enterococcus gilvus]|uniref:hypothetical protein n=1 Tax=Enterococcus gilvus TaxID=160453 RepID=UPI00345E300F
MKKKDFKIIKILSEYKVIINAGERDGIKKGDKFEILDPEKRILEDPDSGEILDEFEGFKARIIAEDVKEKYTICATPKRYEANTTNTIASAAIKVINENSLWGYEPKKAKQDKLNVSEYEIDNIFSPYTNSLVSEGDVVVKIDTD